MSKKKIEKIFFASLTILALTAFGWFFKLRFAEIGGGKILGDTSRSSSTTTTTRESSSSESTSRSSSSDDSSTSLSSSSDDNSDSRSSSSDSSSRSSSSDDDDRDDEDEDEDNQTSSSTSRTPSISSCSSYCHDGIYYSNGSYSSRSSSCQYVKTICDYSCNSAGSACSSAPRTPVLTNPAENSTGSSSGILGRTGEEDSGERASSSENTEEFGVINPLDFINNKNEGGVFHTYDEPGRIINDSEKVEDEKMTKLQAGSIAENRYNSLGEISEREGEKEKSENIYTFKLLGSAKFLGLIPVKATRDIEVDARSGEANIKKHWWDFLFKWDKPLEIKGCGDSKCEEGETGKDCPQDCPNPDASTDNFFTCGNGTCEPGENPNECRRDCCMTTCGDGRCFGYACGEDGKSGSAEYDCPGDCLGLGKGCGNGVCEKGENPEACALDCSWKTCGNGTCEQGDYEKDPSECPDCSGACGDGACDPGEDWKSCQIDCGYVGDGFCDFKEYEKYGTEKSFPLLDKDCGPSCGNGKCEGGENFENCSGDCQSKNTDNFTCGDGQCDKGDLKIGCEADCSINCGDGKCLAGVEFFRNCPQDCPSPIGEVEESQYQGKTFNHPEYFNSYCGDKICKDSENAKNCWQDCPAVCGDSVCGFGENSENCAFDCLKNCGNGNCELGESDKTCPLDCSFFCGNQKCEQGESPKICPTDCSLAICGDGKCLGGPKGLENYENCPLDCKGIICGDGTCQNPENFENCNADCGPICGNNICEKGESYNSCSWDCSYCGDGTCTPKEKEKCTADCQSACGDGICEESEKNNCSSDCETTAAKNNENENKEAEKKTINMPVVDNKGNTLNYSQGES